MKTFNEVCAQGDILITRVDSIPANLEQVKPEGNHIIVTHSETGHHHVMEADAVEMYQDPADMLNCWLKVNRPTALNHLRDHDTHDPIMFEAGNYNVRRQREYTPEGYRRVAD